MVPFDIFLVETLEEVVQLDNVIRNYCICKFTRLQYQYYSLVVVVENQGSYVLGQYRTVLAVWYKVYKLELPSTTLCIPSQTYGDLPFTFFSCIIKRFKTERNDRIEVFDTPLADNIIKKRSKKSLRSSRLRIQCIVYIVYYLYTTNFEQKTRVVRSSEFT